MSDISVNCSHCGLVFSVVDELAGQSTACPQCGKQVAILASGLCPPKVAKLQIKRDNVISGGRRCPSCGGTLPPEAVICIQCGYDTRTGAPYFDRPRKSRTLQWILWGVGLIILAGLAKSFVSKKGIGKELETILTAPPKAPVASPAKPRPLVTNDPVAAPAAAGAPVSAAAAQSLATNKSPVDIAKMEAEYRARLNDQLSTSYPMYSVGEEVVLRRVNGLIQRGTLNELKPDSVVIITAGKTNVIPMKVLDRASRLKCDPEFRVQIVNFHVQKRIKELSEF